jgi:long-subunit acyl-CoA synthetase (AMP-forming)
MHELFAALGRNAVLRGNVTAFQDDCDAVTYAELAARVAGLAEELEALPQVLGLLGWNGVDWVVAQLAAWYAGKTVVPLPLFFSPQQLQHILRDAGIGHLICTGEGMETAASLEMPFTSADGGTTRELGEPRQGAGQIIYTSGSTGRPKGVRHESGQLAWSAAALTRASGATADDVHLSLLPLPLLLETIAAIMVPIYAGARVYVEASVAGALGGGEMPELAGIFERLQPTSTVLVPQLLASWVADLVGAEERAPKSLRFVAVGGASIPPALALRAWSVGIPVHEGYGLSECASVVAVNRPGKRKPGTVGKPLPGLRVRIEDGEIVVAGPSVMDGYLNGAEAGGAWRTGDLGEIDSDGFLTVRGRKDNLLVTSFGRNISPEWIESLILGDPRIGHCVVAGAGRPHLCAFLVPSPAGEAWFAQAGSLAIVALIARCCRGAPAYAVPRFHHVVPAGELHRNGLLTENGRARRAAMLSHYAGVLDQMYAAAPGPSEAEVNA